MNYKMKTFGKTSRLVRHVRAFRRRVLGIRVVRFWPYGTVSVLLTIGLLGIQCTQPETDEASWSTASLASPVSASIKSNETELDKRVRKNPIGLLADALTKYDQSTKDYEGEFVRQEVFKGRLQKLTTSRFKFRQQPFSVAMHIAQGADKADRMLYVENKHEGKLLVHPTGTLGKVFPCVALDPEGERARKNSSRSIKDFGLRNMLERVLQRFKEAEQKGSLRTECMGIGELGGQRTLVLRGTDHLGSVLIELDAERLVPLRIRKRDSKGRLEGLFWFKDLKFNREFSDSTFSKKSNGLSG